MSKLGALGKKASPAMKAFQAMDAAAIADVLFIASSKDTAFLARYDLNLITALQTH